MDNGPPGDDVTIIKNDRSLPIALGTFFVSVAVLSALGGEVVREFGPPLAWALLTCLGVGGGLMVAGSLWPGVDLIARAIEKAGCYLAAAGWTSYLIIFAATLPAAHVVSESAQILPLVAGLIARALYLRRVDMAQERAEASRVMGGGESGGRHDR